MTKQHKTKLALFAGAAALAALVPQVHAQSSDALIDKLLDKGILTADEAKDLREQSDKDFKTAIQAKTGMPDWVTGYKISGDFRGRYEDISVADVSVPTRDRFRYRLRAGLTISMVNDLEAGFRLTSDEAAKNNSTGGDAISGNTTMTGNGTKKFIYIDQVYGKWSPLHADGWQGSATIGKMENPFVVSDIVFDPDYTPEGAALQLAYSFNDKHTLRFNGGAFVLNESSTSSYDTYMWGTQLRYDAKWTDTIQTSLGATYLNILNSVNLTSSAIGGGNSGSWRNGSGQLVNGMSPWIVDASVTYTLASFPLYAGAFPIKVGGDFMENDPASNQNIGWSAGITFGKSGKKGLWEVSYRYKHLEANAWYDQVVDSDTGAYYGGFYHNSPGSLGYGTGTNVKGHVIKLAYSVTDSLAIGATYLLTDLIQNPYSNSSTTGRLQVDASLKF